MKDLELPFDIDGKFFGPTFDKYFSWLTTLTTLSLFVKIIITTVSIEKVFIYFKYSFL